MKLALGHDKGLIPDRRQLRLRQPGMESAEKIRRPKSVLILRKCRMQSAECRMKNGDALTASQPVILAKQVSAESAGLRITTKDGTYFIPWDECSPKLAQATELQRSYIDVLPSGYGIGRCWTRIWPSGRL
jgi:hypothetical protein